MCTDFRLFILTFNEMALILLRPPVIFTVSSLDCSAGNKNAEFQLNGNDVIGQWTLRQTVIGAKIKQSSVHLFTKH